MANSKSQTEKGTGRRGENLLVKNSLIVTGEYIYRYTGGKRQRKLSVNCIHDDESSGEYKKV